MGGSKNFSGGIIDLRNIDFKKSSPFPLSGVWEAFPGELPETEEEFKILREKKPIQLAVPGYWVNQNLPAHGYVTYRLKLQLDQPQPLMLYLREASSAYRLFVFDSQKGLLPLGSSGKVSKSKEDSIGYYGETARAFVATPDTEIYMLVSNYLYSRGGPYYSPILGGPEKTLLYLRFKERKKAIFVGIFLILILYHLVLFLHRPKQLATLWYALLCFSWLLRVVLFERMSRDWFIPSDFLEMLQIRIEYIAFSGIQFFSVLFFYNVYPQFLSRKSQIYFIMPVVISFLITLFTPYAVYTKLLVPNQTYMVIILLISLYAATRAVLQKETRYQGSVILFGAFVIISATIYDSVVFFKRWDLPLLTDVGFTIFSVCLAIVISSQNSHAWETAEYLTLNLRKEVDWKTIELRKEKEKAEKTGELKDKFISIVSHDIRSPLFGISTVVNLLTESPPSLSPERTKQVLGEASTGLKNILNMVEELIKYSRFQNASVFPDYQLFDFKQITDNLLEKLSPLAEVKNLTVVNGIADSSIGIGDPNLIEHLIWNFLTNAVKFTQNGGTIQIQLSEASNHWHLEIKDSGIGMPEYWTTRILEEGYLFVRKGTTEEMGAGVGLAFCREVAERHGAKIQVESKEGEGSIFKFLLPNFDKIILVLDDNPGYRKQLRKIFSDLPCIIWEEEFPDHALYSIARLKPDLIVVDFAMPEKTGLEFLKELYSNSEFVDIHSILVSSSHTDPNTGYRLEEEVLQIGGDGFITKTSPDEKLRDLVKKLLGFEP
ncbi:ATP-binding protein [Leptospira sp. 96542]|nr:ATP-binding protein [Leptospira sp. 96542]